MIWHLPRIKLHDTTYDDWLTVTVPPWYYILFTYLFPYHFNLSRMYLRWNKTLFFIHQHLQQIAYGICIANDVSRKIPYARLIGFKHWNLLPLTITCSYFSLFTVVLDKHDKWVDPQFRNLPNWLIPQLTHRCTVVQREGSRKIPFNSSFSTKSSVLTTKSFSWSFFKIHIRLDIVFPSKI